MIPAADAQDPVAALAVELRRYLALLDRCGLRCLAPGDLLPTAPVAPPLPAPVRRSASAAVADLVAAPSPAAPAAPRAETDAPHARAAAILIIPPEPEADAAQPEDTDADSAAAEPAAAPPSPEALLTVGVGNDLAEALPPPPDVASPVPAANADPARQPAEAAPSEDPDQLDLFGGAPAALAAAMTAPEDDAQGDLFAAPPAEPPRAAARPVTLVPARGDASAVSARLSDAPATPPRSPAPPAPPAAAPPTLEERAAALAALAAEIAACTACELARRRTNTVPGEGHPAARLMFIGEGPGENEDLQGRPFVGRAGQLLDRMIAAMGLAREQVFIANAVKCRPPGNRNPAEAECAACEPFLRRQIAVIRPEVICLLGRVASQLLLRTDLPMKALRGRWHEFEGIPVAVTYHPAYLLRSPGEKVKTWEDLQRVMERLGLVAPEKPAAAGPGPA